jgi:putative acetyltransferase
VQLRAGLLPNSVNGSRRRMLSIKPAQSKEELLQVRALFQEYAAGLDIDLCFQGFDEEVADLPGNYGPPKGRLLLASWGKALAGCVALRPLEDGICEMKRLYVRREFRRFGVGRRLAERIIQEAALAGYKTMRLDSLPSMVAARTLYQRLGFRETAPYRTNPVQGAVFLELELNGRPGDA